MKLNKINDYEFEIEKEGDMNVPVKIFASDKIMDALKNDMTFKQSMNVAKLPGICKASYVMPDAHQGYGFSIGGVAAFDLEKGCISPGGIGFDINCGVRLLSTPLTKENVEGKVDELLEKIYELVPCGVGFESEIRLSDEELDEVVNQGASWAVKNGYGFEEDLKFSEEEGNIKLADASKITMKAKARGRKQLGTLGAGNHFLEIQYVDEIFDSEVASKFKITKKNQVLIMIHCGSRGLGHQVCSDYIKKMEKEFPELVAKLDDKNLIYAPAGTEMFDDYLKAMSGAANFAWANRHIIAHQIRRAFNEILNVEQKEIKTIYDVAHNIAKVETHIVDGNEKKLLVHRKGATRAFPKGHKDLPEDYKETGQPVLIPGSMGTCSYVLKGTDQGMIKSFGSTAHGAGRLMSRLKAKQTFDAEEIKKELNDNNIKIKAKSLKGISEEAPKVYKDVDEVVKVSNENKIGELVARLKPLGVIKG